MISPELKTIRFEGELLPKWAQLLDVAASLCPVSLDVRRWFIRLTNSSGVDDARTVEDRCGVLRANIMENRASIASELSRTHDDGKPAQILGAWMYALDTMIQQARGRKTCTWVVDGSEEVATDDSSGGDITLRRV